MEQPSIAKRSFLDVHYDPEPVDFGEDEDDEIIFNLRQPEITDDVHVPLPTRREEPLEEWTSETYEEDGAIVYRSVNDVTQDIPHLLENFAHETDCTMDDIDERYFAELVGARDAYLE